jgi:O-antigen ligase
VYKLNGKGATRHKVKTVTGSLYRSAASDDVHISVAKEGPKIHLWIFFLYLAVLFFQPADYFPWMKDLRPALSIAVLALAVASMRALADGDQLLPRARMNTLILIFFLAACLSLFKSISMERSIDDFSMLSKVCMLYVLTIMTVRSEAGLTRLVWVLVLIVVTVNWVTIRSHGSLEESRLISSFQGIGGDPNDFGMLQVMIIPFMIALARTEESRTVKAVLFMALALSLYCLVGTRSRGAFLGCAAVMVIYMARNRKHLGIVLGLIALLTLIYVKTPASYWERMSTLFQTVSQDREDVDASIASRKAIFQNGIKLIVKNPVFGVGLGNFVPATERYMFDYDLHPRARYHVAHNTLLEIAAETGIFRMGIFLWMLFSGLKLSLAAERTFRKAQCHFMANIAEATLFGLLGYSVCSLFLSQQYNRILYIYLGVAVVLGSLAHLGEPAEELGTETIGLQQQEEFS